MNPLFGPTPMTDALLKRIDANGSKWIGLIRSTETITHARSLERTVAELREYTRHHSNCASLDFTQDFMACTCGLDTLLARLEGT